VIINTQPNHLQKSCPAFTWAAPQMMQLLISQCRFKAWETPNLFDAVVTLYSWAQPMGWGVEEMRYGFADASVEHFDTDRLLRVSKWAFDRWNAGEQVLIRCQAGLNRSGLVTALTMMHAGYEPADAIRQIRQERSEMALFNDHFVTWLIEQAPAYFEQKSSSSAA
jgi:hypothetical protein